MVCPSPNEHSGEFKDPRAQVSRNDEFGNYREAIAPNVLARSAQGPLNPKAVRR
jgi:hypothetical protein